MGVSFWIGAMGYADYETPAITRPEFIDGTMISGFDLQLGGGADNGDMVCGRIDNDNSNNLIFVNCVDVRLRYMCENCP